VKFRVHTRVRRAYLRQTRDHEARPQRYFFDRDRERERVDDELVRRRPPLERAPPFRPPLREAERLVLFPRPEPLFLPPPVSLLTVAQARRAASLLPLPRFL
jgi:hypothetical protein